MVVKLSRVMDPNYVQNESDLVDDYIQMYQNSNQSKIHYLNGYLYESPTHKGVVCWRTLDEFHKLDNVKHLLASIDDYELDFKSSSYRNTPHSSSIKIDQNSIKPRSKTNNKYSKEYTWSLSQNSNKNIYEGCYNAHDLFTSLQIQKNLTNIYQTLTRNHQKQLSLTSTSNIQETRLLKSNIDVFSPNFTNSKFMNKKINSIEMKSDESFENLERKSLNKISDELKSNCDDDLIDDNQSSIKLSSNISSSSPRVLNTKTKISQAKKNIPPKRNRQRVMTYLDDELSSSDYELDKKAKKNYRQSAFRPIEEESNFQKTKLEPGKKNAIEKTDEELISEFEKISPINFNKLNKEEKTKIDQLCNDLYSNKTNEENSSSKTNFKNLKANQNETIIFKNESSNSEQVEQTNKMKANIQKPSSPVILKDHLLEVYQVQGQKKFSPKMQKKQINQGEQRPIFIENNINNNNNKLKNNKSVKNAFSRIRQKLKIG